MDEIKKGDLITLKKKKYPENVPRAVKVNKVENGRCYYDAFSFLGGEDSIGIEHVRKLSAIETIFFKLTENVL